MCGIAGVLYQRNPSGLAAPAEELARAMASVLVHRGPDDGGAWANPDGRVGLAHRRLSIVDLSPLGRNPMLWDGGRLAITFNGEIYNFLELRRELEATGCRFRSETDTEVILAAYDRWGTACVDRLAGMFAFGLWDQARRRLWLVRDRLGKKPLYYSTHGGAVRFASELKSFVADPSFPLAVDHDALRLFLKFGYVPAPYSIFLAIRKIEPGQHLVAEGDSVGLTRYWDPARFAARSASLSDADAEAELERLLVQAVRQRRIADVPLGAFLSGGVDSSLVVALMQEQSTSPVKTFSIRFENPAFNEADHAAAVAAHLGTDHHEELCGEQALLDVVDRLPDMFDEPFGDSSAIPTFLVSAIARRHVTVALSGDGGDELFFGYPRYQFYTQTRWLFELPRWVLRLGAAVAERSGTRRLKRTADVLRSDEDDAYAAFVTWCNPRQVARLSGAPAPPAPLYDAMRQKTAAFPAAARCGLLDLVSYLPDDILAKVDRASMATSLEVRAPLLDHRVVEFALSLPPSLKWRAPESKWILRQLLYRRVPRALIERPKMGFGVPLAEWFRGPLRERMDDFCARDEWGCLGLDPEPIRAMWQEFLRGQYHRPDVIWQTYVLAAWSRRFLRTPQSLGSRPFAAIQ